MEDLIEELRRRCEAAESRVRELEAGGQNGDLAAAKEKKEKILEKQIEVLEAVVRYWKWRVVGDEEVGPGEEYLIE